MIINDAKYEHIQPFFQAFSRLQGSSSSSEDAQMYITSNKIAFAHGSMRFFAEIEIPEQNEIDKYTFSVKDYHNLYQFAKKKKASTLEDSKKNFLNRSITVFTEGSEKNREYFRCKYQMDQVTVPSMKKDSEEQFTATIREPGVLEAIFDVVPSLASFISNVDKKESLPVVSITPNCILGVQRTLVVLYKSKSNVPEPMQLNVNIKNFASILESGFEFVVGKNANFITEINGYRCRIVTPKFSGNITSQASRWVEVVDQTDNMDMATVSIDKLSENLKYYSNKSKKNNNIEINFSEKNLFITSSIARTKTEFEATMSSFFKKNFQVDVPTFKTALNSFKTIKGKNKDGNKTMRIGVLTPFGKHVKHHLILEHRNYYIILEMVVK